MGNTATVSNTLLSSFIPPARTNLNTFSLGGNFSYPGYNNTALGNGSVGLYIYTVDGPRVTADYYSVPGNLPATTEIFSVTPVLTGNWVKMISFGYSLNGKTFAVAQGRPYSIVQDNSLQSKITKNK